MYDRDLDNLISKALGDSPPAPEELRHNVMAEINAAGGARIRRTRRSIYTIASAAAVFAVTFGAVFAIHFFRETQKNDSADVASFSMTMQVPETALDAQLNETEAVPGTADDAGTGGGAEQKSEALMPQEAPAEENAELCDDEAVYGDAPPPDTDADAPRTQLSAGADIQLYELRSTLSDAGEDGPVLLVRGELPEVLIGVENTVLEEGVYMYEELPEETILVLVADGAEGDTELYLAESVIVLWIPEPDYTASSR